MSTHRTDRGDDDLLRHYRAASTAVDEQPAASARASILAAAARQVHAKPADAKQPYRRARWPLAAAAAVMLSTLAVMLAIRTSEEMPQFSAPESAPSTRAPAAPASEPPPPEQKVVEEAQSQSKPAREQLAESRADSARQSGDGASEPKRAVPASTRPKVEAIDQRAESRANENRVRESAGVPAAASQPPVAARPPASPAPAADAAAPPPAVSAPAPLAKQRAEAEADAASRPLGQSAGAVKPKEAQPMMQAPTAAASAERSSDPRRDAARTLPSASRAEPAQAARNEVEGSAATWLEQIIRLRREARHDEADAELKRFRERYPQVQVPPQALAPTVRP